MSVFFDTNVLVYMLQFDEQDKSKRFRARERYQRHLENGSLLISTQILKEFYVTVTRKLAEPLSETEAYNAVLRLSELPLVKLDAELILAAIKRSQRDKLSFWAV